MCKRIWDIVVKAKEYKINEVFRVATGNGFDESNCCWVAGFFEDCKNMAYRWAKGKWFYKMMGVHKKIKNMPLEEFVDFIYNRVCTESGDIPIGNLGYIGIFAYLQNKGIIKEVKTSE